MGTIRYILRVDKPSIKTGKAPIDLIYQISGQRKNFRTELKLYPQSWNINTQKAVYIDRKQAKKLLPLLDYDLLPTAADIDEINNELRNYSTLISAIERRFTMDKVVYSSEMVIDKLKQEAKGTTKKEASANEVFDFIDHHISLHSTSRSERSLSVYKSVRTHLFNYCNATGKKVTFRNIDCEFLLLFQNYLVDTAGLNNTTVAKRLSTFKTVLNLARAKHIDVPMDYKDFKIKRPKLEVTALTSSEFETLYSMQLSGNDRLAQIRDVFCFACATGFRYSDLAQLRREHIKKDEIKLTVVKTKEELTVPLNPYSTAILAKYKAMLRPLPVISNQNMNYALKDLCKLAGIDEQVEIVRFRGVKRDAKVYSKYELIGVHTARKTFVTLSLEKGMSAEEVMSITGHSDYASFKRYFKVTEQRKKVVMGKAWGLMTENKLKAV